MFTGIIEVLGKIEQIEKEGTNVHYTISCPISNELKVDQSVSHNGVCLTVVELADGQHTVTAIEETLNRTNIGDLKVGDVVNIERAMSASARFDGHFVQGHVDTTAKCTKVEEAEGSWYYTFQYAVKPEWLLVDKGSICINGVSLTVVEPKDDTFSVAIIPYTYENTIFKHIEVDTTVNLEFDVIGKYITKYMALYQKA
ncbi:MAG: riboflavin synthase [Bacteroidota bacterium]